MPLKIDAKVVDEYYICFKLISLGQGTGCLFQKTGKLYQQGETFDDGCEYKCTCTDASKGLYTCQQR